MGVINTEKVPVGILLRRVEARFDGYSVKHIRMQDLPEIANWPKFEEEDLSWANFSATTPALQTRWYQNSVKSTVAWLLVRLQSSGEAIARISISEPVHGEELVLGIVIRPDFINKGIGTEIVSGVLAFMFEITSCTGIWLESHHLNRRARRVWEKIGFSFLSHHYRRSTFGEMEKFAGYRFDQMDRNRLPTVEIIKF